MLSVCIKVTFLKHFVLEVWVSIEFNIHAPVFFNILNSFQKSVKMFDKPCIYMYHLSPTCLINSIKHEHSCKILYITNVSFLISGRKSK